MKKKHWYILIIGTIIFFTYLGVTRYNKFRLYTSVEVVSEMDNWWLHIDRFYRINNRVPTKDEFFYFVQNDSFIIENFPNLVPSGICKDDFILTTDSISYFDIWLFSNTKANKDTAYYSDISFMDFLFKKSILVIEAPLSDLNKSSDIKKEF